MASSKKNYDAVKARNSTLSGEIKSLRSQFAALVDKGRNDDALINQLLEQRVSKVVIFSDIQKRDND